MNRHVLRIAYCVLCIVIWNSERAFAAPNMVTKVWRTKADFERCTWDGNIEVTDEGSVRLKCSVLLQDEQGATHYNNTEQLSATVWAKKQFVLDHYACDKAELYVFGRAQNVMVNGERLTTRKPLISTGWQVWDVPPKFLEKGINEFVFSGVGELLIEHSLYPNRSAKSLDSGKTWDFDQLGNGVENGEYVVRLRLAQYPKSGTLTSEVIDLADSGKGIRPRVLVSSVQLTVMEEDITGKTSSSVLMRTGSTSSPDSSWSLWQEVPRKRDHPMIRRDPTIWWKRFVQWRVVLKGTATAAQTLRSVRLDAHVTNLNEPAKSSSASATEVLKRSLERRLRPSDFLKESVELTSVTLHRSSYPFAYQPPGGRLNLLRTRYKLDDVVAQGKTELEKFVLLREWVRFTAPKGWDHGTTQWCPPWDALIILETNKQPLALCMCTHYSTVFVQCALVLGYNARHVILDHHCVAEVWSNQFRKWILIDTGCSTDPTLNCHFERNGVPLNALEIHNLWKVEQTNEIEVVYTPPRGRINGADISKKNQCGFENYRRFAIPFRNNHLVTPFPGELEQGQSEYFCDLYLWWEDQAVPTASPEYGKTSCRPADFYWTLNETAIDLQQTDAPDALQVTLDTVTPNFDRFLVSIDGSQYEPKPASFVWKLHAGENTLRVKSVNQFGVEGVESVARVSVR